MRAGIDTAPAIAAIDERRILDLEQRSIRIPSSTFEEGEIADLYADYMSDIGLEVEMMEVTHPHDPAKKSRQPIGRLARHRRRAQPSAQRTHGSRRRDERVDRRSPTAPSSRTAGSGEWARTTTRAAASPRSARVEAIVRSGTQLKGDVLVTPGDRPQARRRGYPRAARARREGGPVHQHGALQQHHRQCLRRRRHGARSCARRPSCSSATAPEARAAYMNPIEQQARSSGASGRA